jgi:tryptophanyl-tRNA synthetase
MTRVLSGITPSNEPTLGNYLGAMRRWAEEQHEAENFFFVADLHAMTTEHDPAQLRERSLAIASTLIAVGIDPEVSTLFVQSHVSEHSELCWLIECTARFGELRRMTQFKDKSAGGGSEATETVRASLFTYPCLMAADILLYDIDKVPVGDDQRQHLELTRDVAIRFNNSYGQTFVVPEAVTPKVGARVRDLQDPTKKMSKSSDSPGTVRLFSDPATIEKQIKRAVTDTDNEVRYDPENKPGVSNLLDLLSIATGDSPTDLAADYSQYGPLKADTAAAVIEMLAPVQDRYFELQDDPSFTLGVLAAGAEHAREIASRTLDRAKTNIGLLRPAV